MRLFLVFYLRDRWRGEKGFTGGCPVDLFFYFMGKESFSPEAQTFGIMGR